VSDDLRARIQAIAARAAQAAALGPPPTPSPHGERPVQAKRERLPVPHWSECDRGDDGGLAR
jgi:hypothetical protein